MKQPEQTNRMEESELGQSLVMIDRSMADIKAGRTHEARQAIQAIANELGLELQR